MSGQHERLVSRSRLADTGLPRPAIESLLSAKAFSSGMPFTYSTNRLCHVCCVVAALPSRDSPAVRKASLAWHEVEIMSNACAKQSADGATDSRDDEVSCHSRPEGAHHHLSMLSILVDDIVISPGALPCRSRESFSDRLTMAILIFSTS